MYNFISTLVRLGSLLVIGFCLGCHPSTPSPSKLSATNASIRTTHPCTAPDDGARLGYHAPGDSTWLPDCDLTLNREYWRVFLYEENKAYVIPRPDGTPEFQPVCSDPFHPLHDLVNRYSLCEGAQNSEQVEAVNNILPEDALQITRFLHTQLLFKVSEDEGGITPFPIPSDIIDACNLNPSANKAELSEICDREQRRLAGGQDIGMTYTGPGAAQLAERLNELYGISSR